MPHDPIVIRVPKGMGVDTAIMILQNALKLGLIDVGEIHGGWLFIPEVDSVKVDRDGKRT